VHAFVQVTNLIELKLLESDLDPALVNALIGSLAPSARAIAADLVGLKFGPFTIVAA
jgi:hypothetical protein